MCETSFVWIAQVVRAILRTMRAVRPDGAAASESADTVRPAQVPWTFTVAQALDLPIFRDANAQLAAGASQANNVIRWVHSAEITDIARFLSGGEFLLTAGTGVGETEDEQRAYVGALRQVDVAGVGIELSGRAFTRLPSAVIDEADRIGLPIVTFGSEVPFVRVAAQIHERLTDLRVQELLEAEVTNAAFTDLLLAGADSPSMVSELARRVSCPSVLEDGAHQMRAYYGRTSLSDTTIVGWNQHSRLNHDQYIGCTRKPIVVKGDVWGSLHVLYGEIPLSSSDLYTIDRAAAAIAITLLSEEARGARRSQRVGALVNRLMLGDITGERFVDHAISLGRDFRHRSFMALVAGRAERDTAFGEPELSAFLTGANFSAVVTDLGEECLAIVAIPHRRGEKWILDAIATIPAHVGVSRVTTAPRLRLAIQQAINAYESIASAPGSHPPVRFDDLGVSRLLLALAQGPELASYVEDELGRIMEHDANSANVLLPTLRAYLACDGRKAQAAQQLFVQRRTLYYRLERIESLLEMSLQEAPVRQRLQLAVNGLDLLNQRSSSMRFPSVAP